MTLTPALRCDSMAEYQSPGPHGASFMSSTPMLKRVARRSVSFVDHGETKSLTKENSECRLARARCSAHQDGDWELVHR
jgi:hypothetical protein